METRITSAPAVVRVTGYDVHIGDGLLARAGELLPPLMRSRRAAVITDSTVAGLYSDTVTESLARAGIETESFVFPAGERSKNLSTLGDILEFLAEKRFTRPDSVIALGGGVTGDMAGFAAGCYLRGVDFFQLPTTFLAAVDSSVGGKTAVDLAAGKNLAGLFVRPKAVLCDTGALATLPDAVFADGAAEAVKTAILAGGKLFGLVWDGAKREDLPEIIARCVGYKGKIVESDEFETGPRRLLNLGHTAGHAIELLSGYTVPHGRAVAVGTAIIARAAAKRGICYPHTAHEIVSALERNGLPVTTEYGAERLADAALSDKKRAGDSLSIVVPHSIGDCSVERAPVSELAAIFADGTEA